ncbi:unnamed protein product [Ambrosiozyma monospora]|uniref:Unnamed protein product n=1 Tax=Ambrosiozyma monospora TaxID=43982 RepID=A0A9W7DJL0_AMBMO|nr:unnamed protein product [Ambrosiozyma monospora]
MDESLTPPPAIVDEDNYFDFFLPLPYRVLLLLNFGIWLWYINLKTCSKYSIDFLAVLKISPNEVSSSKLLQRSLQSLYKITSLNVVNYLAYFLIVSNGYYFKLIDWFPFLAIFITFNILFTGASDNDQDEKTPETKRFTSTAIRILKGGIDISIRNNDILLADTFTSYNKVLIDFLVYFSALILGYQVLPSSSDLSMDLSKDHLQMYNLDLILSCYPSLIRFSQCVFEWEQSRRRNKQHLGNAIKYSTSFVPVFINLLIRGGYIEGLKFWYLATFVNSAYSFFWDVTFDWNFVLFNDFLNGKLAKFDSPVLRHRLIYNKFAYFVAIILDLQLRFIWVYRIIFPEILPRADHGILAFVGSSLFVNEFGTFMLEILEILRRWIWVFLKIETEYVKSIQEGTTPTDIELQNVRVA